MNSKSPVLPTPARKTARITSLKVENFRALRNVEFKTLAPLTVLLPQRRSRRRREAPLE
jgi:hypothetical protein